MFNMNLTKRITIANGKKICKTYFESSRTVSKINYGQDPEVARSKPIFQYATENTKRSIRVYMWGNVRSGALGSSSFIHPKKHQKVFKTMHKPYRLEFSNKHKVVDIACGYGFTVIAASTDGSSHTVFGTGFNYNSQIGYHCVRKGHPLKLLGQPVPILLPLVDSSTKAVKVACGRAHTIIVTDKEGVFSLGNNEFGQCGYPIVKDEVVEGSSKVNKVEGIDGKISQVVCGEFHTLFLTVSGEVYSCGYGGSGQTGLDHYKNQGIPAKVIGDIQGEKIVQLSSTTDCVLAVSEKGDVFGWGNSEYGQLYSVTDTQEVKVSRHLNFKKVGKVSQVAAGHSICAVVTDQGLVYVWGYGILGQGPNVDILLEPTQLPETLFGVNEFNLDEKVEQITCGQRRFAAITNKGVLYMWGKNQYKSLGLGKLGDQFFPLRVSVPAEVKKVICGHDHTAALCRGFC